MPPGCWEVQEGPESARLSAPSPEHSTAHQREGHPGNDCVQNQTRLWSTSSGEHPGPPSAG